MLSIQEHRFMLVDNKNVDFGQYLSEVDWCYWYRVDGVILGSTPNQPIGPFNAEQTRVSTHPDIWGWCKHIYITYFFLNKFICDFVYFWHCVVVYFLHSLFCSSFVIVINPIGRNMDWMFFHPWSYWNHLDWKDMENMRSSPVSKQ